MSFLGRVARLADALGIPSEGGAVVVLGAAAAAMDEQVKEGMTMPDVLAMVEVSVGNARGRRLRREWRQRLWSRVSSVHGTACRGACPAMGIFLGHPEPKSCPYSYSEVFL